MLTQTIRMPSSGRSEVPVAERPALNPELGSIIPNPIAAVIGGGAVFLLGMVFLLNASLPAYHFGFILLVCFFFGSFVPVTILIEFYIPKYSILRYRKRAKSVWFSSVIGLRLLATSVIPVFATLFALYGMSFILRGMVSSNESLWASVPRSAWVLSAIMLLLGGLAWRDFFRVNRAAEGVRLSPGTIIVKDSVKHARVELTWDEVHKISTKLAHLPFGTTTKEASCLILTKEDGRNVLVEAYHMGSDPNLVAAIMRFYLDHPEEREALKDPDEAFRRFRYAQARA